MMLDQNKEEDSINVIMEEEHNLEDEDMMLQNEACVNNDKITLADTIKSNLIDIVSTGIMAIAALFIFDVLLRAIAGYYVTDRAGMLLIFYVITSLIYTSIMEYKKGDTIGKRVANIRLSK
ncbi:RDD family protein [Clostridium sp. MB40-C1]|uniref:RDD family protein n=1 Tax=Clostridium sp. MB40-C1 TaxID=3070996 RepID=UPI0027E05B42|nr:RDD family protein [Clostridium sp. MB40-C1]WMJ81413.1 RDD family protein [Clostridium sp. MB40-C1]